MTWYLQKGSSKISLTPEVPTETDLFLGTYRVYGSSMVKLPFFFSSNSNWTVTFDPEIEDLCTLRGNQIILQGKNTSTEGYITFSTTMSLSSLPRVTKVKVQFTYGVTGATIFLVHFNESTTKEETGKVLTVNISDPNTTLTSNGHFGNALTNGMVYCNPGLNLLRNDFTIEYWAKAGNNTVGIWATGANEIYFLQNSLQVITIRLKNGTAKEYVNIIADGGWHHYAAIYESSENKIHFYYDGTCFETLDFTISGNFVVSQMYMFARSDAALDEVRISRGRMWTTNFVPPSEPYSLID